VWWWGCGSRWGRSDTGFERVRLFEFVDQFREREVRVKMSDVLEMKYMKGASVEYIESEARALEGHGMVEHYREFANRREPPDVDCKEGAKVNLEGRMVLREGFT